MRMFALTLLLLAIAGPARAQMNPSEAWIGQRQSFLSQNDHINAVLQTRGHGYLAQTTGNPNGWWAQWRADQPYAKGVSYQITPGTMDIPAQPDEANTSPFGKNLAALNYGKASDDKQASAALQQSEAADMSDLAGQ